MPAAAKRIASQITVEEFLDMADQLGPGRHILVDGVIYLMAPTSPTHAVIQMNVGSDIRRHIEARKLPFQVMGPAGVQPRLHKKTNVRIPDVMVSCGPHRWRRQPVGFRANDRRRNSVAE